jgi:CubicO group peptidase (beta-lactamase class C family)
MREMNTIFVLAFWTSLSLFPHAQELSSRIEPYLVSQSHENGFRGEVLVAKGDELLIKRSFQASSSLSSEVSQAEGRFPAGSIAEQFIAAAILQLELAGQVKLDSPVCDYISDCPGEWKQIHIQHLLTHSSGLPSLLGVSPCVEPAAFKPPAVIAMLSGKPLLFEPGNRFNLNRLDDFFLSLVIEKISGQSTSEYLDQHIFHPLNLAETGYFSASQQKVTVPQKTGCIEGEPRANPLPSSFSGELYTSIDDLYRWNRALLQDKFLPDNSRKQMYTPYIEGHAFGWKILKEFGRKVAVQNHESGTNSVSVRVYPDDDTCIIVVSRGHEVAASGLSHDVGSLLFGKQYPASSNPRAAHH